ncbi:hypothetical protein F2P56_026476 [Juglans regia]|uniref:Uncharacterized protein LOC109018971 isoform X2 n=2 Tax=Juglans regia TaxID=51240 RepID=A0A2I4HKP1_JUGRE|nr:uncharacterized protein LOC109018971 isoform X2 [Juglans regia]KAF5451363.1 hypothetical protein F2P56_026476 [Juglans regia]
MSDISRLCSLIDKSLGPYTEPQTAVVSLTKENEKAILIALSKVVKEIQLWTRKIDRFSDDGKKVESASSGACSCSCSAHSENDHCLAKIVADLVVLLTFESQYVRHLAGNAISFVSKFLAASEGEWDRFIHFLCVCMELAIANALSFPSVTSTTEAEDSNHDSLNLYAAVNPRLKKADFSTVTGIIQVLRNILKYLKQDADDHLLEVFLDSVDSCLSNVRWDLLDEIYEGINRGTQKSSSADASYLRNINGLEPRVMFLGMFLQLLCSLVDQIDFMEAASGSIDKHPIHLKIVNLVPKFLYWCLGKQGDYANACIPQYFRHKLLVLMIRLSSQIHLECSILVSWLQLLYTYFQELLWQPITQPESCQDECLEGSPFLLSVSDGEMRALHSRHIQRQAIFLFIKYSFSLISPKADTDKQCECITPNSGLTLTLDLDCCCRKEGLLALSKWFQGHLLAETFLDHELYFERCITFTSSFLQLFLHEDDMLFKMLLQLLGVPFFPEQQGKGNFQDAEEDTLFHVSNLFNPIHLFHLFLLELHYDHQVLLDYLISKDTGISCAEYLLRCLRMICDSWCLFVEFSLDGKGINQSSYKKRKVTLGGSKFLANVTPRLVQNNETCTSVEKECKRDDQYGHKKYITQPFEEAKECLLSLRNSVESLHEKNLFPYNPKVLLKRLTRFQELCLKKERYF